MLLLICSQIVAGVQKNDFLKKTCESDNQTNMDLFLKNNQENHKMPNALEENQNSNNYKSFYSRSKKGEEKDMPKPVKNDSDIKYEDLHENSIICNEEGCFFDSSSSSSSKDSSSCSEFPRNDKLCEKLKEINREANELVAKTTETMCSLEGCGGDECKKLFVNKMY